MSSATTHLQQEDQTALFRKSWTLYDAISEKNYMFHRDIYAKVAEVLGGYHQKAAYSVLDLGCGNARFMAPCLHIAPPSEYHGVDLSAAALQEAEEYLNGLPNVVLHHADMLQTVESHSAVFDVVFSGFAVHHLDAESKQRLFHACAKRLAPGGCVLMVDIAREEGQTREAYLEGYIHFMRTQWTGVMPDHLDQACAHVTDFDYPETLSDLSFMARQAGLINFRLVSRHAQHHTLMFTAE